MTNFDFQKILDKLNRGETPQLNKTVDGQTYTRVFLPETRLIYWAADTLHSPYAP